MFLPAAAAVPELSVPRRLGSLVLRRDVEAFWRDHEGIVAVEFDAEFAKLNSTIAAIFGVRRMDEDVLLHLAPVSQFVSARQTYSGLAANPKIAIPAFAMILQEKEPNKKVTDGFRRAFQTAVALGSAERAQKEKMALGLSEETLGDVKITFATFPDPEGSGPVDAEYNYSPAFFAKGPYIVFSTTLELARDLVKSLDAPAAIGAASPGEPSGAGPALDSLELWGEETRRALEENFDAIVAQNMLEKGQTRAEARTELRGFIDLVSLVSRLRAETRERGPGLELSVRIDTAGAAGKTSPASEPAVSRPRQAVR